SLLVKKLENSEDPKLAEGVLKFSCKLQRLMKSMNGNLTSALFNSGAAELSKSRNGKKIKVQPNRKRKSSNGSHQAVAKGRPAAFVAVGVPTKKAKRSHSLAVSVAQNTNVSRKSGSHVMKSRTRHVFK
ncbi:Hypothetical predicted protein, partial [Paramuricea clavata]